MPCDHFSITVPPSKLEDVISFLTSSMAHVGFKEIMRPVPQVVGIGEQMPYMWISGMLPEDLDEKTVDILLKRNHIAFSAKDKQEVQKFHEAALKAGGICNGPPGFRPEYHPMYYAAFVRDPACGINFEMVCHRCPAEEANEAARSS